MTVECRAEFKHDATSLQWCRVLWAWQVHTGRLRPADHNNLKSSGDPRPLRSVSVRQFIVIVNCSNARGHLIICDLLKERGKDFYEVQPFVFPQSNYSWMNRQCFFFLLLRFISTVNHLFGTFIIFKGSSNLRGGVRCCVLLSLRSCSLTGAEFICTVALTCSLLFNTDKCLDC